MTGPRPWLGRSAASITRKTFEGNHETVNSSTGKQIRLGRLIDPRTSRGVVIAYSHSFILGPQEGTESTKRMEWTLAQCESANAIMLPPGLISRYASTFAGPSKPGLVVHLDWTNFSQKVFPHDQGSQTDVATIAEVVASGADAVMTYLLLGYDDPERDAAEIRRNARIARECEKWGVGLIIEPRYAQERAFPDRKTDVGIMSYYCRVSSDLGADVVKCIWPGSVEAMRAIVDSCPAPILVAGGAYDESRPEAAFDLARDVVAAGASGLIMGRNIYQSADPAGTLSQIQGIVHGRATNV